MKTKLSILLICLVLIACSKEKTPDDTKSTTPTTNSNTITQPDTKSEMVYICTGSHSKRYHRSPDCRGLSNCSRDIEKVSLKDAQDRGRTPCEICY